MKYSINNVTVGVTFLLIVGDTNLHSHPIIIIWTIIYLYILYIVQLFI